jgi:hypothetical protein
MSLQGGEEPALSREANVKKVELRRIASEARASAFPPLRYLNLLIRMKSCIIHEAIIRNPRGSSPLF